MTQDEITLAALDNFELDGLLIKGTIDQTRELRATLGSAKAEYQTRKDTGLYDPRFPGTALTAETATALQASLAQSAELDQLLQRANSAATAALRTALRS
jgi:hypothetical protein